MKQVPIVKVQVQNRPRVHVVDVVEPARARADDPLVLRPERDANARHEEADVLIMESTYGNRLHPDRAEKQLTSIVNDA